MKPHLAIRSFLKKTGLGYEKLKDHGVSLVVPTDKLLVHVAVTAVNNTLAVLVTLPTVIPNSRKNEFERAFGEFSQQIEWGQIALVENTVHVLVTMGFETDLIPEQVQLCFEQAFGISSTLCEGVMRWLITGHTKQTTT